MKHTHLHHHIRQNAQNHGFTLIELLVVISIIGLLASVVLVALQGARNSAKNARIQEDVLQLRENFELNRSSNGTYSDDSNPNTNQVGTNSDNVVTQGVDNNCTNGSTGTSGTGAAGIGPGDTSALALVQDILSLQGSSAVFYGDINNNGFWGSAQEQTNPGPIGLGHQPWVGLIIFPSCANTNGGPITGYSVYASYIGTWSEQNGYICTDSSGHTISRTSLPTSWSGTWNTPDGVDGTCI